jgi:hypothetical protein
MKAFLLIGLATLSLLLTGCRTVAVVDHGGPRYVRSGYYHSRPSYYSSRGYYGDSRYYGRSYSRGYYGDRSYSRDGYRSSRSYYPGSYYGRRSSGATVILR